MISLIIPATSSNQKYTDFAVQQIRELYPNENEVEIVVEVNDDVTLGINFNNAVAKAKGDVVVLMHNDMVPHPGFVETILKHIKRKMVLVYHRVEPPIYPDEYAGKSIFDCGRDIENFNKNAFFEYQAEDTLIDGGSQLFFAVYKDDYLNIDGYTFKKFCEDDDVHLRYGIAGYDLKTANGAMVYHFVSKTSRFSEEYQNKTKQIEYFSNLNFIRKWGFRNSQYNKKYNVGIVIKNCNVNLLQLEPWCSNLYVDCNYSDYINSNKNNTTFNLNDRIKNINEEKKNDIVIEFDGNKFNQQSFGIIQSLSDILTDSGEIGTFELDIFKITINSLQTYQQNLINTSNSINNR